MLAGIGNLTALPEQWREPVLFIGLRRARAWNTQ
jgi:hypothetical protein